MVLGEIDPKKLRKIQNKESPLFAYTSPCFFERISNSPPVSIVIFDSLLLKTLKSVPLLITEQPLFFNAQVVLLAFIMQDALVISIMLPLLENDAVTINFLEITSDFSEFLSSLDIINAAPCSSDSSEISLPSINPLHLPLIDPILFLNNDLSIFSALTPGIINPSNSLVLSPLSRLRLIEVSALSVMEKAEKDSAQRIDTKINPIVLLVMVFRESCEVF